MSVANKIFSNTLWQVVLRIVNILVGVFNLALITRILGQGEFGFYTTIFAFVQMFMILADLGLYLALLREISTTNDKQSESKAINNIFTIRLLASLFVLLLIPLVVQAFPYDSAVKTGVIFFMIAFFFQSLISTLTAVFSKKLEMPRVSAVDLLNKALYFFLLVYLFKKGGNLNLVLLTHSLAYMISFFVFYQLLRKHVVLRFAWDFQYWKKIFHTTWPLAVTVVLNLVYFKADTLILSAFDSPVAVGLYGAPYRVLEVLATFPHMFMSLVLPLLTAAWIGKNYDKLREVWQNSFDLFAMMGIGMIVGTWLVSTPLMSLVAGEEFAASGPILNVLVVATAAIFFGTLYTYLVVALGAQREMIKYFLIAAVVGLVGYFIFIPLYSVWAAAIMTLVVELLIWYFAYLVIKKHVDVSPNWRVFRKTILVAIITYALAWPLTKVSTLLAGTFGAIIYIGGLFVLKAIDKKKIKQLLTK